MTVQPRARHLQYSVSPNAQTFEGWKSTEKNLDLVRLKAVLNQNFLHCPSALVFSSDEPTLDDSRMVCSPARHTQPSTNLQVHNFQKFPSWWGLFADPVTENMYVPWTADECSGIKFMLCVLSPGVCHPDEQQSCECAEGMALDWKILLSSAVNHSWLKSVTASLKQSQECNSKMLPLIFIFNI